MVFFEFRQEDSYTRVSRKPYYEHLDYGCLQRLHVVCIVCMFYICDCTRGSTSWLPGGGSNSPGGMSLATHNVNPQVPWQLRFGPKSPRIGYISGFDFQGLTQITWLHNCQKLVRGNMATFHGWQWQVGNSKIMSRHLMCPRLCKTKESHDTHRFDCGCSFLVWSALSRRDVGRCVQFCVAQVGNTGVYAPYYYSEDQGTILSLSASAENAASIAGWLFNPLCCRAHRYSVARTACRFPKAPSFGERDDKQSICRRVVTDRADHLLRRNSEDQK